MKLNVGFEGTEKRINYIFEELLPIEVLALRQLDPCTVNITNDSADRDRGMMMVSYTFIGFKIENGQTVQASEPTFEVTSFRSNLDRLTPDEGCDTFDSSTETQVNGIYEQNEKVTTVDKTK